MKERITFREWIMLLKENPCEAVKTYFNAMLDEKEKKTLRKLIVAILVFCAAVLTTILIIDGRL